LPKAKPANDELSRDIAATWRTKQVAVVAKVIAKALEFSLPATSIEHEVILSEAGRMTTSPAPTPAG
jgi:hypothetical protein